DEVRTRNFNFRSFIFNTFKTNGARSSLRAVHALAPVLLSIPVSNWDRESSKESRLIAHAHRRNGLLLDKLPLVAVAKMRCPSRTAGLFQTLKQLVADRRRQSSALSNQADQAPCRHCHSGNLHPASGRSPSLSGHRLSTRAL